MSIITKTGDKGTTALMYGRRVMKCHPRVEAYGTVDELNSALGLARATATHEPLREYLLSIQKDLVILMGELAVAAEDLERYVKDGNSPVTPQMVSRLEKQVYEIEAGTQVMKGWATPGGNLLSASLDAARTVCRIFLNRLADLLWLLARRAETKV